MCERFQTRDPGLRRSPSFILDDGGTLCHPLPIRLHLKYLQSPTFKIGAERNRLTAEVIFFVATLGKTPPECLFDEVREQATLSAVLDGTSTLEWARTPLWPLSSKQEETPLVRCTNEFNPRIGPRESLEFSRVDHTATAWPPNT